MATISLENLTKTYPNGHIAVRDLNLNIADGELLVLLGPSGCGKTTTLRLVAGLEEPTSGRVFMEGRDVTRMPPHLREVAMVFQSYALYPHLTVRENLAFGLRMQRVPKNEIDKRLAEVVPVLGLEPVLQRKPEQLSGGERQRVALGRAMVRLPKAFLLDEPLSNLDAQLRVQMRTELARIHRQLGTTMLYVTHDQEEALTLGDRVAVLQDGVLQQVAPPLELYRQPCNVFVARFIGSPAMNLLPCTFSASENRIKLESKDFQLNLAEIPQSENLPEKMLLGIRPHDLAVVEETQADLCGRVEIVQTLGHYQVLYVRWPGAEQTLGVVLSADSFVQPQQKVGLRLRRDRLHFFDAVSGERLPV